MATRKTTRRSNSKSTSTAKENKMASATTTVAKPAAAKTDAAETTKRKRNKKPAFPVEADKKIALALDATSYEYPEGYDPEKHAPLKKGHFDNERSFIVYKALRAEKEANDLWEEAKEWKPTGTTKRQQDKMEKMKSKMQAEASKLIALGMDAEEAKKYLSELLAGIEEGVAAPAEEE